MRGEDRVAGLLLTVGLVCALAGQFYFAFRREYVRDGALFWGVSILALSALMWRVARKERGRTGWSVLVQTVREHPLSALAATGGVCLSFVAGWRARQRPDFANFGDLLALWLIAAASFVLAFAPRLRVSVEPLRRMQTWARRNGQELAGLFVLLLIALVVRAYNLAHIPANLGGDEGTQGVAALELVAPPLGNPFSTGWYSVPTMSFLAYGMAMRVFGATVAGLRALSALVGTATVLTTFVLGRELWGRRVAWLSAAVLASSHYHIHFSRLGSNQIFDAFFITGVLWLLVRGLRTRRAIDFALAGGAMGLGWYGYFGARLVVIVVICYLAVLALVKYRFLARYGRFLLVLAGAALVVLAPLLLYYAAHPDPFASRLRQVSIFASGWLAREQEITGRGALSLLLQQFWKAVSAFNYTLDPTFWYRPSIPLLDSISGALFVFGLMWVAGHCRRLSNSLLLIWFWLALLLGWVMTENPPSSQRMVVIAPALALLVGLGTNWMLEIADQFVENHRVLLRGLVTTLLVGIVGLNLGYYFFVYTPTRVYGNPTAEMTTVLGRYLKQQRDDYVVYFHGPPFVYWDFGTLRFVARGVTGMDVLPPGEGPVPEPDLDRGARFVFHPERIDELSVIRARYPGGMETHIRSNADGELLYAVYEIER
jgi:4-amino-4-deoxy-L-arabinose transferase-like glycosyltransferase